MSASDAAPLPRLGEVFFDVRGHSRTMRLSWYADTGVAVFSIWQGGRCTGTFRLPIDDLPRMVEILRAGPPGRPPATPAAADAEPPAGDGWADAGDEAFFEQEQEQEPAGYPGGYSTDSYSGDSYSDDSYSGGDSYGAGYRDDGSAAGGYRDTRYDDAYPADRSQPAWSGTGSEPDDSEEPGRFVPPYVRQRGPSYRNDNSSGQAGYPAGFGGPAYPSDRHADSATTGRYRHAGSPDTDYEGDADYRLSSRRRTSGR